jgi:adenylate cyclase class 2
MCLHEVEVKAVILLEEDLDIMEKKVEESESRILEAGGFFKKEVEQMDIYLSHPSRDYSKTDEAFRIRVEDGIKLTYKGPKVSKMSKTRIEKEVAVNVDDIDGLRELFSYLGFKEVMSVIKTRKIYDLDGVEIDLDKVTGLGVFCEMEIISEEIGTSERRLIELMGALGWNELERRSYLELLLEKQF